MGAGVTALSRKLIPGLTADQRSPAFTRRRSSAGAPNLRRACSHFPAVYCGWQGGVIGRRPRRWRLLCCHRSCFFSENAVRNIVPSQDRDDHSAHPSAPSAPVRDIKNWLLSFTKCVNKLAAHSIRSKSTLLPGNNTSPSPPPKKYLPRPPVVPKLNSPSSVPAPEKLSPSPVRKENGSPSPQAKPKQAQPAPARKVVSHLRS